MGTSRLITGLILGAILFLGFAMYQQTKIWNAQALIVKHPLYQEYKEVVLQKKKYASGYAGRHSFVYESDGDPYREYISDREICRIKVILWDDRGVTGYLVDFSADVELVMPERHIFDGIIVFSHSNNIPYFYNSEIGLRSAHGISFEDAESFFDLGKFHDEYKSMKEQDYRQAIQSHLDSYVTLRKNHCDK